MLFVNVVCVWVSLRLWVWLCVWLWWWLLVWSLLIIIIIVNIIIDAVALPLWARCNPPDAMAPPINIYIYIYICIHTYIHTYLPTYLPTYIHTYIHVYIYIYIYIYTPYASARLHSELGYAPYASHAYAATSCLTSAIPRTSAVGCWLFGTGLMGT